MEEIIRVENLRKTYGKTVAVDDISFGVAEGEIFGLLGPNGAGKTTAVECLQGLRTPDSGTIRILGIDPVTNIRAATRAAQGIGLLLFFVMLILAGAGPPREVMTGVMRYVGDATPLRYVILLLQDPWLGFGWDIKSMFIVLGITVVATVLSLRFFKWE